jgi:hypothetical protein
MPELTFLALENPPGVNGTKIKGLVNTENALLPLQKLDEKSLPGTFMVNPATKGTDQFKYLKRYQRMVDSDRNVRPPEIEILPQLAKDSMENRNILLELLGTRSKPNLRVAMCSSINSTLNYIRNYIQHNLGTNSIL